LFMALRSDDPFSFASSSEPLSLFSIRFAMTPSTFPAGRHRNRELAQTHPYQDTCTACDPLALIPMIIDFHIPGDSPRSLSCGFQSSATAPASSCSSRSRPCSGPAKGSEEPSACTRQTPPRQPAGGQPCESHVGPQGRLVRVVSHSARVMREGECEP
jgi:hypothetical protein